MTDEGKKRLEEFVSRRTYYFDHRKDFVAFAKNNSQEYHWEYCKKRIGFLVFLVSIPVFWRSDIGLEKWLSMFGIILGLAAGISAKASKAEMHRLIAAFLKLHGKPISDLELAYRVFTDEKRYSDLPQIQSWIWEGLLSQSDLDDSDLQIDLEE